VTGPGPLGTARQLPKPPLTYLKELVCSLPSCVLKLALFDAIRCGARAHCLLSFMSPPSSFAPARDPLPDHEQKQTALSYLNEAWAEARHDGVDGDCLAQASLFAAFAELVGTYGEDAVAKFVEGLPVRVRNGEFSLLLAKQ
jgi:hypothetical protein